jgi:hypothetical protein
MGPPREGRQGVGDGAGGVVGHVIGEGLEHLLEAAHGQRPDQVQVLVRDPAALVQGLHAGGRVVLVLAHGLDGQRRRPGVHRDVAARVVDLPLQVAVRVQPVREGVVRVLEDAGVRVDADVLGPGVEAEVPEVLAGAPGGGLRRTACEQGQGENAHRRPHIWKVR